MTDISKIGRNVAITIDGKPIVGDAHIGLGGNFVVAGDLVPGRYYEIIGGDFLPMENRTARRRAQSRKIRKAEP